MTRADDYNKEQLLAGVVRPEHLTLLTERWQAWYDLTVDGFCGPATLESLDKELSKRAASMRQYPLATLPDGRRPIITSGFWEENQDRDGSDGGTKHLGVDFGYRWLDSDPDMPVGDGGAVQVNGKRRFFYPELGTFPLARMALAAASGKVMQAGHTKTGWRCWIAHADGLRSGYFHLARLDVSDGQVVAMGQTIGVVGHNPDAKDPVHLHFEVSPISRYAPQNPRLWLQRAEYVAG